MTPQEKQHIEQNIRDMMQLAMRKPEKNTGNALGLGATWLAAEKWSMQAKADMSKAFAPLAETTLPEEPGQTG